MQLNLLKKYLADFSRYLSQSPGEEYLPHYETQRNWQLHFDIDAPDFAAMYDKALDNQTTRRLWQQEKYTPKKMMLLFIQQEPAFVRDAFRDLFNEEKSVENRIDRFVFYCDQFLEQYRRANPLKIDSNHYHDYTTNSLYLAFQFPDLYVPYEADILIGLLAKLGVRNLPVGGDFERHVKVMRTIYLFMEKEEGLLERHRARLRPQRDYEQKSLVLVREFAGFILA